MEPQIEPKEKHIPVITKLEDNRVLVKVGAVEHPMTEEHFIEWIELYKSGEFVKRVDLTPTDKPEATFEVEFESLDDLLAREHCNLHGTWQSDKEEMVV